MINPKQLVQYVVEPTLRTLDMYSEDAVRLVLCTGVVESNLSALHQIGGGPALGIYQMEPATHDDIWRNYLDHRKTLGVRIKQMCAYPPSADQMIWNLAYATAMCRVHYWRVSNPIPSSIAGMAGYWKKHYNTPQGAGTVDKFVVDAHNVLGLL